MGAEDPEAQAIDAALAEGKIVRVSGFGGDTEAISGDFDVLDNVQSRFGETIGVVRSKTGRDPWVERRFPIDEQEPTLLMIMGQNGNRFFIRDRLNSPLDSDVLDGVIFRIPDEGDCWPRDCTTPAPSDKEAPA